jgi:hypothetical protein
MNRLQWAFGTLVVAQAGHSTEEYVDRLWEVFPPARFVSGLFSEDLERGFVIANVALVAFGLWASLWPIRRGGRAALPLAWAWVTVEMVNGIGHPLWTLRKAGYTPGVDTAPALTAGALVLAAEGRRVHRSAPRAA